MKRIRVYRHPDCETCARKATLLKLFDWLDRTESSTAEPKSGPLRLGEVIVEDIASGDLAFGAKAFDLICAHIPLYMPFRLLLFFPPLRRAIERDMTGAKMPNPEEASKGTGPKGLIRR